MPAHQPKHDADGREMVVALSAVVRSFIADIELCETEDELLNVAARIKTAHCKKIISEDEREALMPAYLERKRYIEAKREAA